MDSWMLALRIPHMVFGVMLVGNVFFLTLFLEPRLRGLGPAIQNPVMGALMPVVTPVQLISWLIVVGTGIAMTLIVRWGSLDSLLTTGWGWAILVGTAATLAAGIVGFGLITPLGSRIASLARSIKGPPTPDQARELAGLGARLVRLSRINFILGLVVVVVMAMARYL